MTMIGLAADYTEDISHPLTGRVTFFSLGFSLSNLSRPQVSARCRQGNPSAPTDDALPSTSPSDKISITNVMLQKEKLKALTGIDLVPVTVVMTTTTTITSF